MTNPAAEIALKRCPLFRKDLALLEAIRPFLEEEVLPSGTYLFQEGHPGNTMYVMGSGIVAIQKRLHGEAQPLQMLKAGDYFGEICALVPGTRLMSAKTLETTDLFRPSSKSLDIFKKENPEMALRFYDVVLKFFALRYRFAQPVFDHMMGDAFSRGVFKPGN